LYGLQNEAKIFRLFNERYRAGIVGVCHLPACITRRQVRAGSDKVLAHISGNSPASRADGFAMPFLRIARNTGPVAIPAQSSQDRKAAAVLGDSQRTAPAPS
jgi:hypothetical protein